MNPIKLVAIISVSYYTITYCDFTSLTTRLSIAVIVSLLIAKRGYDKKSLNLSGAISAVIVGFVATVSNLSSFCCLLTFFVTSSFFTKWKSDKKRLLEENFKEGGERNVKQVFCNGGVLVLISLLFISEVGCGERIINFSKDFTASVLITSMLACVSCCNGDTWSSEIGTVFSYMEPRLVTSLRKVPVGTNGGITIIGLMASSVAGLVIGLAFLLSLVVFIGVDNFDIGSQIPVLVLTVFAGTFGSLVDSILGALLQYSGYCSLRKKIVSKPSRTTTDISGNDVLDNDQVNLLASVIMAVVTPLVAYYTWPIS